MKNYLSHKNIGSFLCSAWILVLAQNAIAQTEPPAQSLPFSFTEISGGTLPAGVAVHRFGTTYPDYQNDKPGKWRPALFNQQHFRWLVKSR